MPEPVSQLSPSAVPTGVTTPIPEPGFIAPEPTPEPAFATPEPAFATPEPIAEAPTRLESGDMPVESTGTALAPEGVAPEYAAHEQVHASASENPAYDLTVDVSSIVGAALRFVPAESAGVAPQVDDPQRQIVVNDEAAEAMFARSAPVAEKPAAPAEPEPYEPPAAEAEPWAPAQPESWTAPAEPEPHEPPAAEPEPWAPAQPESWTAPAEPEPHEPPAAEPAPYAPPAAEQGPPADPAPEAQPEHGQQEHEGEHSKWFDRAKMWAANNLYDPDEDETVVPHDEGHGQDEPQH
jgi:nicotinate-nucleotide--dimethylbenzimidazole phosphoribosyltransferase